MQIRSSQVPILAGSPSLFRNALVGILSVGWANCLWADYKVVTDESYIEITEGIQDCFLCDVPTGSRAFKVIPILAQKPGSLRGTVAGSLPTTRVADSLVILSGAVIDALSHPAGPFLPVPAGGAAEDNFGGKGPTLFLQPLMQLALRDLQVTITQGTVQVGQPATDITFAFTQGVIEYAENVGGTEGRYSLVELDVVSNQSTQLVTGSLDGRLQVPIEIDTFFDADTSDEDPRDSRLVMAGTLVLEPIVVGNLADLNRDGAVDAGDAAVMFGEWDTAGNLADLNQDQLVDAADAGILFASWTGDSVTNTSLILPEPACHSLWLVTLVLVGHRARFRKQTPAPRIVVNRR